MQMGITDRAFLGLRQLAGLSCRGSEPAFPTPASERLGWWVPHASGLWGSVLCSEPP